MCFHPKYLLEIFGPVWFAQESRIFFVVDIQLFTNRSYVFMMFEFENIIKFFDSMKHVSQEKIVFRKKNEKKSFLL